MLTPQTPILIYDWVCYMAAVLLSYPVACELFSAGDCMKLNPHTDHRNAAECIEVMKAWFFVVVVWHSGVISNLWFVDF
jgi:hypothetical protein